MENQLFKKHDIIKQEDAYWQCIVCDNEYATFGRTRYNKDDEVLNTSFENIFIVSNLKNVSEGVFIFEMATGKDVKDATVV
jgi:hypothetical protein